MPFDATPTSIADKMRAILGPDGEGWCKWYLESKDGKQHCLVGALLKAEELEDHDALGIRSLESMRVLSEAVASVSPHHKRLHGDNHWTRIAMFNNDNATSYGDIVRVLDEFAKRTQELSNAV